MSPLEGQGMAVERPPAMDVTGEDQFLPRFHSSYMKNEMMFVGKEKIETPIYTIKVRRSEQTEIDDEFIDEAKEKNLNELIRVVPEKIEPDKKAIKEYINSGHELTHARIIEKQNLNIK